MSRVDKNVIRAQGVFAVLMVCVLASIYAAQVSFMVMFYICIVVVIILSLGMLYLVLQENKALEQSDEEILRLRQREKARLQRWQQATEDEGWQKQETFKGDEMLARILPAAGTDFEKLADYTENVLQNIAREMDIVQGLIFVLSDADQMFHISGQYAYHSEEKPRSFPLGETLSGQVAKNRKLLNIKELPEGYVTVLSGLGKSDACHLIIAPVICNYKSIGIMELASFKPFGENEETLIRNVCDWMALLLNELRS